MTDVPTDDDGDDADDGWRPMDWPRPRAKHEPRPEPDGDPDLWADDW